MGTVYHSLFDSVTIPSCRVKETSVDGSFIILAPVQTIFLLDTQSWDNVANMHEQEHIY